MNANTAFRMLADALDVHCFSDGNVTASFTVPFMMHVPISFSSNISLFSRDTDEQTVCVYHEQAESP